MHGVERDMPVDPARAKYLAHPAAGVGTANPDLASRAEQAVGVAEGCLRLLCVLQHIGQDQDLVVLVSDYLLERRYLHSKTPRAGDFGSCGINLEAFGLVAIGPVKHQPAALIAAHIEKATPSADAVKGQIPVQPHPHPIPAREQESLSPTRILQ